LIDFHAKQFNGKVLISKMRISMKTAK